MALALCFIASIARAQQPPNPDDKLLYLASVQYGKPLRAAGSFAVFVPVGPQIYPIRNGAIVEGGVGQGGMRISGGAARFFKDTGFDGRVVLTRTWRSPRAASADSAYGGVEGSVSIWYIRMSAGAGRRIGGTTGERATMVTWSVAVQVPFAM